MVVQRRVTMPMPRWGEGGGSSSCPSQMRRYDVLLTHSVDFVRHAFICGVAPSTVAVKRESDAGYRSTLPAPKARARP